MTVGEDKKATPLAESGVLVTNTAREAADPAECILLMLSDASAIEEVLWGEHPLDLRHRTVIQMGTIASTESRTFLERVQQSGGEYLEAPVLGSRCSLR